LIPPETIMETDGSADQLLEYNLPGVMPVLLIMEG